MKNLRFLAIILLFAGGIQGCKKIKDVSTVDINGDLQKSFTVNITESDTTAVSEQFSVDASSNTEINKYLNNVKQYQVKKVTYKITNYTGSTDVDPVILNGTLDFGTVSASITNLNLQSASTSGTDYDTGLTQDDLNTLATEMKSGNSLSGDLKGSVSGKPVTFTVVVTVSIVMTANVL